MYKSEPVEDFCFKKFKQLSLFFSAISILYQLANKTNIILVGLVGLVGIMPCDFGILEGGLVLKS